MCEQFTIIFSMVSFEKIKYHFVLFDLIRYYSRKEKVFTYIFFNFNCYLQICAAVRYP